MASSLVSVPSRTDTRGVPPLCRAPAQRESEVNNFGGRTDQDSPFFLIFSYHACPPYIVSMQSGQRPWLTSASVC